MPQTNRKTVAVAMAFTAVVLVLMVSGCSLSAGVPIQVELPEEVRLAALDAAISRDGCLYVWGAQGPDEFDCSGLILWAYSEAFPDLRLRYGNEVVDDATMHVIYRWNVRRLMLDEIEPGDVIFITNSRDYVTHGGLFIRWIDESMSEFEFINASSRAKSESEGGSVVIDTWPVEGIKREQWFAGAGRLLTTY